MGGIHLIMPKGSYKPTRDRRKLQPGPPAGFAAAGYQLRVFDVDAAEGIITIACVMNRGQTPDPVPVIVWRTGVDLNGIGIRLTQMGIPLAIDVDIAQPDLFTISTAALDGNYTIWVPALLKEMTTPGGIVCVGMAQDIIITP